ncbi:MAG: serine/threonine protein kinase [Sandaracinaceae bacterium]
MPVCPQCKRDVGTARFCPFDGTPLAHLGSDSASSRPEDAFLAPGEELDGRYVIEKELGRGAIGVVYAAFAPALGRPVAIKVLQPALARNNRALSRFAREARASSRIDHPSVVKVFDFGYSERGLYFIVMELLEGRSLAEVLHDEGRLPPPRALNVLIQVAEAVARAHELGMIHRDLKPENIMVNRKDGERVTVVDFGLTKAVNDDWDDGGKLTREGTLIGTPEYMSPEQWMGSGDDPRTDVYAFGVLAYETLSGDLPIDGNTIGQLMKAHMTVEPPPLDEARLGLPDDLWPLIRRCLTKRRDERPADLGEVAQSLREISETTVTGTNAAVTSESAVKMTEVVLDDFGAMSSAGLEEEIERLRRVRSSKLKEVVAETLHRESWSVEHVAAIDTVEAELEALERDQAIARDRLTERQAARREREAELRHAMISASLRVGFHRDAIPEDLLTWDSETIPDVDAAQRLLREAEAELAQYLVTPDFEMVERFDAHATAKKAVEACDQKLQQLYERLEDALSGKPGGTEIRALLRRIDGAIAAYRAHLAHARERKMR